MGLRLISGFLLISHALYVQANEDLFSQIQNLQSQTQIAISGLEKIQNGEKVLTHGIAEQQITQLFAGYNHIVSRNRKGKIERIVILGKKEKAKDNRIQVPTRVKDNHSTITVSLSGDGRNWQTLDMVIDTGADLVVLPESMISQLGLADFKFTVNQMQTANGVVKAKLGTLQQVNIAGEIIENVEVAFLPDLLLGENRLLGMSVLGRFQVNLDDQAHIFTLIRK